MAIDYEELDYKRTALGELILRRRSVASLGGRQVYEVRLADAFLMSSVVNKSEIALANLVLDGFDGGALDVVVGGLGLGHTAMASLDHHAVESVLVIEYIAEVIDWHRRGLVPLAARLTCDPRCRLVNGDFFALLDPAGQGLDPADPGRRFHAILVDIDHSPRSVLHRSHAGFYRRKGLAHLAAHLHDGGRFGLWSAEGPDADFTRALGEVFTDVCAHEITFYNPIMHVHDTNTIYVAQ